MGISIHIPQLIYTAIIFLPDFCHGASDNPPRLGGADPEQAMVILVRMTQWFF